MDSTLAQGWVQDDFFVPLKTTADAPKETPEGLEVKEVTGRTYPLKEAAATTNWICKQSDCRGYEEKQ